MPIHQSFIQSLCASLNLYSITITLVLLLVCLFACFHILVPTAAAASCLQIVLKKSKVFQCKWWPNLDLSPSSSFPRIVNDKTNLYGAASRLICSQDRINKLHWNSTNIFVTLSFLLKCFRYVVLVKATRLEVRIFLILPQWLSGWVPGYLARSADLFLWSIWYDKADQTWAPAKNEMGGLQWIVLVGLPACLHIDHRAQPRPLILPKVEIGVELIQAKSDICESSAKKSNLSVIWLQEPKSSTYITSKTTPPSSSLRLLSVVWHHLPYFLDTKGRKEEGAQ